MADTPGGRARSPIAAFGSVSVSRSREARPASRGWGRLGLRVAAAVGVVALLVSQRSLIGTSLRVVGHLKGIWLLAAVGLEAASMASFGHMQCRLLRAGTARVGLRPVLATVYAGNALSATLPLAGSQMSLVFVFRRFKQLGVEATVAAWTMVVAGVISSVASAILLVVGAILTGNDFAAASGAAAGIVGVGLLALGSAAIRCPAVLGALHRPAGWALKRIWRVLGRPAQDPHTLFATLAARLASLRLSPCGWLMVVVVAFVNWLADAGVLAASLVAVGAPVPWRGLLFAYAVGTAVQSLGIVPGGIGVVEGALALALMGAGVRHPLALAAVLVYRFVSFWMVISVGWVAYLFRGRAEAAARLELAPSHRLGNVDLDLPVVVVDV
jgi:putative heme transporter